MAKRTVRLSAEQVRRLLDDVRAVPDEPVGVHLSRHDFVGYATETLRDQEIGRIDNHLASCDECASEMEQLLEAAEAARAAGDVPAPSPRGALGEKAKALLDAWLPKIEWGGLPEGAMAAVAEEPLDIESEDRMFGASASKDHAGNVLVRISSQAMALEGVRITLFAGNWEDTAAFEPHPSGWVMAKLKIPRAEREKLPVNAVLRARLADTRPAEQADE